MPTPADRALYAADRLATAAEHLGDFHQRNPLDRGSFPAPLTQQMIRRLLSDVERAAQEYRRAVQRVPRGQPA